jgi:hypothetical protein
VRVSVTSASALCFLLLAASQGHAQVPVTSSSQFAPFPSLGFIPPYEIARTVRRSGFDPLAPPLREGSTYVVRATDFRGILMRVVVDARSGAIRDVNRIVPGPGSYGQQAGMVPYGPEPDDMPYGQPADYDLPPAPLDNGPGLAPPRPSRAGSVTRASVTVLPPLPRPRPPELASRNAIDETKPETKPGPAQPTAVSDSKPAGDAKSADRSADKPKAKSEVTESAPAATPLVPPATAAAKPGKSLQPPPIND